MAKHLLIIEREHGNRENLQSYLASKGYEVHVADTVRHGLELLHSLCIDGILLSLDMLEINDEP